MRGFIHFAVVLSLLGTGLGLAAPRAIEKEQLRAAIHLEAARPVAALTNRLASRAIDPARCHLACGSLAWGQLAPAPFFALDVAPRPASFTTLLTLQSQRVRLQI